MKYTIEGDGSFGIDGKLSIEGKDKALSLIQGLMESFDITTEDLEWF